MFRGPGDLRRGEDVWASLLTFSEGVSWHEAAFVRWDLASFPVVQRPGYPYDTAFRVRRRDASLGGRDKPSE